MSKIKNKNYREFLDNAIIKPITEDQLAQALGNVKGKHVLEGRACLIALYYTGARPNEVLRMRPEEITKEGGRIKLRVPGSKSGVWRTIYLSLSKKFVKELLKFSQGIYPGMLLFHHYRSKYTRAIIKPDGTTRYRHEIDDKLRYHLRNWFDGVIEGSITPYFLRHSRFSKLAEKGATLEEIRQIKGSKTIKSVYPYLHMSSRTAKKLSRMID